jgi:hypothetical protein
MTNVGFRGGSTVRDLGTATDMKAFFHFVRRGLLDLENGGDYELLTDRLYRRYLRLEDLDKTSTFAQDIHDILMRMPSGSMDWKAAGWVPTATRLDLSRNTVADVFDRYINSISALSENAKSFERKFHIYRPVMTIISDLPRLHIDQSRPLAEYDLLESDPIWLRP